MKDKAIQHTYISTSVTARTCFLVLSCCRNSMFGGSVVLPGGAGT